MDKPQTLAEFLGTAKVEPLDPEPRLEDIADAKQFAEAILTSRVFRCYVVNSLVLGSIPAAVILRIMDLAGWQKPPERIEHTGKDGRPIETITEVRRVVVRPRDDADEESQPRTSVH